MKVEFILKSSFLFVAWMNKDPCKKRILNIYESLPHMETMLQPIKDIWRIRRFPK
jgi:hypothetical protein